MKPFICASGRGAGPIKFSKLFYNASVSVGAPVGVNVTIVKAVSDGKKSRRADHIIEEDLELAALQVLVQSITPSLEEIPTVISTCKN